ncbi:hypothetical protein ABH927_006910 [Planotetraspora sp. GP83]
MPSPPWATRYWGLGNSIQSSRRTIALRPSAPRKNRRSPSHTALSTFASNEIEYNAVAFGCLRLSQGP